MLVAKKRLCDGSGFCGWATPRSAKRRWTRWARSMSRGGVDAHGLVVGHPVAGGVRDVTPVEPLQECDQLVAPGLHSGRAPGARGCGHQGHPVPLADVAGEELGERGLGQAGGDGREVEVVEQQHEGAAPDVILLLVRGDPGARPGRGGGGGGDVDRLEAHHRLFDAVLEDLDVLLGEPLQGDTPLVRDHHVDRDLIDLAGERGEGLLGRGRGGRLLGQEDRGPEKERERKCPLAHATGGAVYLRPRGRRR